VADEASSSGELRAHRPKRKRSAPALDPSLCTSIRPDAFRAAVQPKDSYLTTTELAEDLARWAGGVQGSRLPRTKKNPYDTQVYRWCRRDWFGALPPGRNGRGLGYRIPLRFRYVARLWQLTEDLDTRRLGLKALTDEDVDVRPWLVMVGRFVSTHYTEAEALAKVEMILTEVKNQQSVLKVLHVGPITD
jgi:hypothetical protein